MAAELESLGVPCAGLMPVGLDTAIIPDVPAERTKLRGAVGLDPDAKIFVFVGGWTPTSGRWTWCRCSKPPPTGRR